MQIKNMIKKIVLAALLGTSIGVADAQFVYDYLKAADKYFVKGDYASSAEYYEKYFGRDKMNEKEFDPYTFQNAIKKTSSAASTQEHALYQLAESYRMLKYPSKAEPAYRQVITMNKARFPLAAYHYAGTLRSLGKYAEAEQTYKSFLDEYKTDDFYYQDAQRELQNLQFIQAQLKRKDLKYYTVTKAPAELNTTGANYAPVWLDNTTLLFTSTRPDTAEKVKEYTNRLYQAVYTEGTLGEINKTSLPQDNDIQQGVVSITPDGNTLFLTRWTVQQKVKNSAIYSSTRTKDGWSKPVKLDESINAPGANSQQPFVTPDGKYLLYASDRSGGQGGFDLWYAELNNGTPGPSMNMGTMINTTYDEQAPFYHAASGSLIFSSNGRIGMGGYDFFQSKGAVGNWGTPENLGYPVNSIKDDIYFTSRGTAKNMLEDVVLSSDREAACCLEMFYLKKIRPMRRISGQVTSCDPSKTFPGGDIVIMDPATNKTVYTAHVNADGTYTFTMEDYQPLTVKATAEGFISKSLDFNSPADPEEETMTNPVLCLVPVPPKVNETFIVKNVYYDFNKSQLKPESYPALDEIVRMMNTYPDMVIELSAHTDSKGSNSYNMKLSEARARTVVEYLRNKGIDESRLKAKGYGETMPIAPNTNADGSDNPEGREQNRRTEFKVLKN